MCSKTVRLPDVRLLMCFAWTCFQHLLQTVDQKYKQLRRWTHFAKKLFLSCILHSHFPAAELVSPHRLKALHVHLDTFPAAVS